MASSALSQRMKNLRNPTLQGWHTYDYDGGIDAGSEPPPDGVYTVIAETRDKMGQRVTVSDTLEIVNAGLATRLHPQRRSRILRHHNGHLRDALLHPHRR